MGVKGIHHLLRDIGWLDTTTGNPDDDDDDDKKKKTAAAAAGEEQHEVEEEDESSASCGCTGQLWKDWPHEAAEETAFSFSVGTHTKTRTDSTRSSSNHNHHTMEAIPANATFLIDGNGLAFYLHAIAYTRYVQSLTITPSKKNNTHTPNKKGGRSKSRSNNTVNNEKTVGTTTTTMNLNTETIFSNNGTDARPGGNRHNDRGSSFLTTQEIVQDPIATTRALPCMLPLAILRMVTKEWMRAIMNRVGTVQILWDGPKRTPYKMKTDQHRQHERDRIEGRAFDITLKNETYCPNSDADFQESLLELYCNYGTITKTKNNTNKKNAAQFVCQWTSIFPFSKLFLTTVRHALREEMEGAQGGYGMGTHSMIECTDEADGVLAKMATGKPLSYVLGYDSDFFFYKDINYIPFNQISIAGNNTNNNDQQQQQQQHYHGSGSSSSSSSSGGIRAFVARRSVLTTLLGFETNESKVLDLVLLMGNDYIDPKASLIIPKDLEFNRTNNNNVVQSIVYYLQCHDDYELTAKTNKGQQVMDYIRNLYNLINDDDDDDNGGDFVHVDPGSINNNMEETDQETQPRLLPSETTVRDGIIRYLRIKMHHSSSLLSEMQLQAFEESSSYLAQLSSSCQPQQTSIPTAIIPPLTTRPTYQDMKAAEFIEGCIKRFYRNSSSSSSESSSSFLDPSALLIRMTPPDSLMSRIHFHAALESLRQQQYQNAKEEETAISDAAADESITTATTPSGTAPIHLPIDDHEDAILENIRNHRVTIIHGETGCGKSSRVPVMILQSPPPDGSLRKVKFFISQPRRIAAKALVERVRSCVGPDLRDKFALRMGHGWREYETKETQVHFVTTGYLVRLLANHPEKFNECTHLVIDEVHERSVDTDILCLLCRRLLETNKTIRIVLMSATLATKMYRDYFAVPNEPIHVGVRTYPISEIFVEDLPKIFQLPSSEKKAVMAIQKENESKRCATPPTSTEMKNRFGLAARLATIVGEPGSSVLIFVPGMAEIIAISEIIETCFAAGIRYTCFPIHGDIPFEEQMDAFNPPEDDEVKVIIATNAAESSVTLPSVDHVICLGLCRQIIYNQASHRQMLTSAWISRASATQRAGRTGRVRPGNVYRLYTRKAYESCLEEFEPGEMVRIPLDSVILMLKQILHEEVKPIFLDCLEPPSLDTIDRSFQSLCYWNFITGPNDTADITPLGSFVSSLGVDLSLGSFIGLGIQFGVAAEAIEMAAMMSLPKTPFMMTSPMWHGPGTFNKIASQTYTARNKFDAGLYSEPMMLMNAVWDYENLDTRYKNTWLRNNFIAVKRWNQVVSSRKSLRKRVADFFGIHEERLHVQLPPRDMPHEKSLILRVLSVWVFSDSIIECPPSKLKPSHDGSVTLSVKGKSSVKLQESHLVNILKTDKHPFSIVEHNEVEQTGVFEVDGPCFCFSEYVEDGFESRLLSYMSEMNIQSALCHSNDHLCIYLDKSSEYTNQLLQYLDAIAGISNSENRFAYDFTDMKRRGVQERPCGLWLIFNEPESTDALITRQKQFIRIELYIDTLSGGFTSTRTSIIQTLLASGMKSKIICEFLVYKSNKKKKKKISPSQPFSVANHGECRKISKSDLEDLLGGKPLSVSVNSKKSTQSILIKHSLECDPRPSKINGFRDTLIENIPEGARILALLASIQRKDKCTLKIPRDSQDPDSEETYDFRLKEDEIDVLKRWRRLGTPNQVYVDESVPSSAISTSSDLFAVAANSLELQRGGLRVETLTLLPPNPLFLLLSHLSFGIEISTTLSWASLPQIDGDTTKKQIQKAYTWLINRAKSKGGNSIILSPPSLTRQAQIWKEEDLKSLIRQAFVFHESASIMGEQLVCFPDQIHALCSLFDGIDGHNISTWESIDEESLTEENLSRWRKERKFSTNKVDKKKQTVATPVKGGSNCTKNRDNGTITPVIQSSNRTNTRDKNSTAPVDGSTNLIENRCNNNSKQPPKNKHMQHHAIRHFGNDIIVASKHWFITTLDTGDQMSPFPSTNIIALLFQMAREEEQSNDDKHLNSNKDIFNVSLNASNWDILCYKGRDRSLYKARFVNNSITALPVLGRGKNKLSVWIKKNRGRPSTIVEANECVPPNVISPTPIESESDGLLFQSIEDALRMESAFWLDQQFCHAGTHTTRHWYEHSMEQMIGLIRKRTTL